ncbi:catechol 2,3-dioxygenase-like lactoylglutathione lyase family enzyme [Anoxybacillus mongoliensis]|uniref:Catechol 2,3-dioxygenase-like lactoylglutathione lyase family enzyme n=1 Tax=Anoxybacillus mongoliensis TaxID=452565 RepID=A0A7W8N7V5_9BACL|nr:VOC family protein [Anoxybacillus mongoliensis]MBB5354793.1 catechol 2,3-dioxygenase-like lactoylglutathione lyase family enzyme [Anoxybacillus mongoliensis]MCX8002597.1 VOC family protein [Anoxybacillus mongoliensis]
MNIVVKRLDHVQICIPIGAEDEARAFYTGVLGFTEIEKPEPLKASGGLWYKVGDIGLHIGVENREGYRSKSHPAFEVENIEAVRRYLEEKGVMTKDEKAILGVDRFSFLDPFHNRIEFLEKQRGQ